MKLKYLLWTVFGLFAIGIGVYPLVYYIVDMHGKGLFSSKSSELLSNQVWHSAFYIHITFGGIAMLTGWTQFSRSIRNRRLNVHRTLGKIYVFSVMLSSLAGLYIAQFASGGIISRIGFSLLAICWFVSVTKAYATILKKHFKQHENWMIRNYALTFAAVTLRIYLPLSQNPAIHIDFLTAYRTISWLCWVPNLIIAEIIISKRALIPAYATKPKTTDYFQD
jgi:uncharacterized membrane protein